MNYLAENFLRETIRKTKYEATSRRNLEFSLTLDQVLDVLQTQNGKCALTGWNLEFTRGGDMGGRNPQGCTLDRKDNSKGYTKENIQLVCCRVNIMRSNLSIEDFTNLCRAVTNQAI